MLSSLTLSPSVSTQSEAAWEAHTIMRRAASLLIRLGKGEAGVTMATSLHLQCTSWPYGLINRRLPSLALVFPSSQTKGGGGGRFWEEKRGELFVQARFWSISRSLRLMFLKVKYDPRYHCVQIWHVVQLQHRIFLSFMVVLQLWEERITVSLTA